MEEQRHRLVLLYARLHDALIAAVEDERLHNPLCPIPDAVALPEWHGIKNAITKPLSIWNIALMRYPYRDVWPTDNPNSQNFANKRRWLVYELLDAVYRDEIKIYQYPVEIDNQAMFKRADINHQAKAEIHVNSLRAAIVEDCVYWGHFKVVKLWDSLATACQSPSLPFQDPPTPIRLQNTFTNIAFFRSSPDDVLTMQTTTENLPEDINLEFMDSWEIWRQQHAWKRNPIQGKAREIIHRHLGIIPAIIRDETQAITDTTTDPPTNTPDGLPIPWLMKEAGQRKLQLPGQMTEAAYRLFRKLNQRNHDSLEELFNLLTPEYLPDFVAKRNTQINAYLVELILTDGRRHNYENFRKNACKKFI